MSLKNRVLEILVLGMSFCFPLGAATGNSDGGTYMLPMNCSELLPENSPFLNFFEAVGRGQAASDKHFAERVFRILSLRDILAREDDRSRLQNPVDFLVRKTLCFFREQKEPLRPVAYDDKVFLHYLRGSMGELENKVNTAILQAETDREERSRYERKLLQNQKYVDGVQRQAEAEAQREYKRIRAHVTKNVLED